MTFVEFVQGVAGLSVTGVKRKLTAPPTSIGAADLPLSYPRIPVQTTEPQTLTTNGSSGTVELAIVVAPDGLDTKGVNFALACTLVDALNTALTGAATVYDGWTIRQTYETYGGETGTLYMVLVATVEGSW